MRLDPSLVPWCVAIIGSMIGAAIDVRSRKLPNWLTGSILLGGLVCSLLPLPGALGGRDALLGCVIAGAPFVVLWLMGGGGAGDAKMMLALGAWVGPRGALYLVFCVAIAGGALAIALALMRGRLIETVLLVPRTAAMLPSVVSSPGRVEDRRLASSSTSEIDRAVGDASNLTGEHRTPTMRLKMPYGLAIFAGTLVSAGLIWLW